MDLVGSWTVAVGDLDQCVHLWKFTGGFERIDNVNKVLRNDAVSIVYLIIFSSTKIHFNFLGF